MSIFKTLKNIRREFLGYNSLIKIYILKQNIIYNLNEYKKNYPDISFAPVLKSNAYGHGLVEVAEIVSEENVPFIVVDSLPEAIILRKNGIKTPILIIGYTNFQNINNQRLSKVAFTMTSLDQLREISNNVNKKLDIHLKIDTGMHRQGVLFNEIDEAIKIIKSNKNLFLLGVCSHFADADGDNRQFTDNQVANWNNAVSKIKKEFDSIKYFHISATSGVDYMKEASCNVARIGLGLYGVSSSKTANLNLKPALRMESQVSSVKKINKGDSVGYNATFTADRDMTVATIPVGYYEGVDRELSNKGVFKIGDTYCTIIGRVNMNITSIDVSEVPGVKIGDKVVIISEISGDKNSLINISKISKIPWEILIHIPQPLKRIVI